MLKLDSDELAENKMRIAFFLLGFDGHVWYRLSVCRAKLKISLLACTILNLMTSVIICALGH